MMIYTKVMLLFILLLSSSCTSRTNVNEMHEFILENEILKLAKGVHFRDSANIGSLSRHSILFVRHFIKNVWSKTSLDDIMAEVINCENKYKNKGFYRGLLIIHVVLIHEIESEMSKKIDKSMQGLPPKEKKILKEYWELDKDKSFQGPWT